MASATAASALPRLPRHGERSGHARVQGCVRVLGDQRDPAPEIGEILVGQSVNPAAVETHLPGRGTDQPQQGPQYGGFSRAGTPDQSHAFPREEGQVHLVEGLEGPAAPAEDHIDAVQFEQRIHSSAP